MKINVLPENKSTRASEKEKQIIHVSLLNFIALISALVTHKGAVSNPLDEHDSDNIGFEVFLDPASSKEEEKEFIRRISNQTEMFLSMAEVSYKVIIEN